MGHKHGPQTWATNMGHKPARQTCATKMAGQAMPRQAPSFVRDAQEMLPVKLQRLNEGGGGGGALLGGSPEASWLDCSESVCRVMEQRGCSSSSSSLFILLLRAPPLLPPPALVLLCPGGDASTPPDIFLVTITGLRRMCSVGCSRGCPCVTTSAATSTPTTVSSTTSAAASMSSVAFMWAMCDNVACVCKKDGW
jgi:hypothetical protein